MAALLNAAVPDIAGYLKRHEDKPLLRFITCGSVDDGKSTLIGRLLVDSKTVLQDQLAGVERGGEAVEEQREVELAALGADPLRVRLERLELVVMELPRLVQQPADQGALAVVDAAAGDEAQQLLVLPLAEVLVHRDVVKLLAQK